MTTPWGIFWTEESGQDLIEYTLLIAFLTFASAGLYGLGAGGSLKSIWTTGNNTLGSAATQASGS